MKSFTPYELGRDDYERGGNRGFGGDDAWGERQRGWDDAKREAIERWLSKFPSATSLERRGQDLNFCHPTFESSRFNFEPNRGKVVNALVTFDAQGAFFSHRGPVDAITHWLEINGADEYEIMGNYIKFVRLEDALMCYLGFSK